VVFGFGSGAGDGAQAIPAAVGDRRPQLLGGAGDEGVFAVFAFAGFVEEGVGEDEPAVWGDGGFGGEGEAVVAAEWEDDGANGGEVGVAVFAGAGLAFDVAADGGEFGLDGGECLGEAGAFPCGFGVVFGWVGGHRVLLDEAVRVDDEGGTGPVGDD